MANNTQPQLPDEVTKEIKQSATTFACGDVSRFVAYSMGATEYATKLHNLQSKYDLLIKSRQNQNIPTEYPSKPWQPLFDYLSGLCEIPPTLSEMDDLVNVVEKMIGHKALQAKCERYEKALKNIEVLGDGATIMHLRTCKKVANEALAGEGEDSGRPARMFSFDEVDAMLMEFAVMYHKSPCKDIANDAAEYLSDKLKEDKQ
jgi:hypothetical protein